MNILIEFLILFFVCSATSLFTLSVAHLLAYKLKRVKELNFMNVVVGSIGLSFILFILAILIKFMLKLSL